ncbi:hypothetical protein ACSW29_16680 [Rhodococcus sp. GB-02]
MKATNHVRKQLFSCLDERVSTYRMSTKTVDILELAELMHCSKQTILNNRKLHPLYRRGFKNGVGRSSKLLWFQDDVDEYFEMLRKAINQREPQFTLPPGC